MEEETNNENRAISKEAYGILALLLGAFGVHDFAAKNFSYGCWHLLLSIAAVAVFSVSQSSFLPPTLILGSWVWAIVENLAYQKSSVEIIPQDKKIKKKLEVRGFLVFARTAEVFICLTIILEIVMAIQSKNWVCNDTSCNYNKLFAYLLLIPTSIFTMIMSIVFADITLARRKELPSEQRHDKVISRHISLIGILGIILAIAIITVVILELLKF